MNKKMIIVGILVAAAIYAAAEGVITTQSGSLMLNPADGKVGIGTSPQRALTIPYDGTIGFKKWAHYPDTVYGEIGTNSYTMVYNSWGADYPTDIMHDFRTSGGSRLIIQNSGNVGIGTTNPTSKLDVAGDIEFDGEDSGLSLSKTLFRMQAHGYCTSLALQTKGANTYVGIFGDGTTTTCNSLCAASGSRYYDTCAGVVGWLGTSYGVGKGYQAGYFYSTGVCDKLWSFVDVKTQGIESKINDRICCCTDN